MQFYAWIPSNYSKPFMIKPPTADAVALNIEDN